MTLVEMRTDQTRRKSPLCCQLQNSNTSRSSYKPVGESDRMEGFLALISLFQTGYCGKHLRKWSLWHRCWLCGSGYDNSSNGPGGEKQNNHNKRMLEFKAPSD